MMSRVYTNNRFVPHTYKRACDICGFDYLMVELVLEPQTNSYVCPRCGPDEDIDREKRLGKRSKSKPITRLR